MQNIFIELLPPWIETGLQPAFYDKESGTVLQQTARMYAKVIELGQGFNTFSANVTDTVNSYITQFNELYTYVHDYFDNLDVQEEINNKLDDMADDGTLGDILAEYLHIDRIINVLNYGVVGDGSTDDTQAIQDIIDEHPNTTLYFPDGTYLVSAPIVTPAPDDEKVFLELSQNATIKASSSFDGSFMLNIGGSGTATTYGATKHKTGINGGILDCNSVCNGIKVEKTHLAKITNVAINNVDVTGIQIESSDTSSSDVYAENIDMLCPNHTSTITTGLLVNAGDNNFNMIRTGGFKIGVALNNGGNYLTDVHPLYGDAEQAIYETTAGFIIKGNNNHLTNCYSDNFSTAILVDGNYRWYAKDFYAYWYSNDNVAHTAIKCNSRYFKGRIDGLVIEFPSNGTNRGLWINDGNYYYPEIIYANDDMLSAKINGLWINNWSYLHYKYSDPILLGKLNGAYSQTLRGSGDGLDANKWYPLAIFTYPSSEINTKVHIGANMIMELSFVINSNTLAFHDIKVLENRDGNKIKFAVGKITEVEPVYVLYFMITDKKTAGNNWTTKTIIDEGFIGNHIIIPRDSIYSDASLNGITSITSQVGTDTVVYQTTNSGEGFIEVSDYTTTHSINLRTPSGNGQRGILLFIHYGTQTGVYGVFINEVMPINVTGITNAPTFNVANGVLTITTSEISIVNYIRL